MALPIKQLRQKREAAQTNMQSIATAAGENLFTAEQTASFNTLKAERDGLDAQIAAYEDLQASDRTANIAAGAIVGQDLGEKKPWVNVGEQLHAIKQFQVGARHKADPRILAALGQSEGVDADGGFALAPQFSTEILTSTYEVGQLASRCFEIPMASKSYDAPAVDEKSRANGSRWGGVQAFWEGEAEPLTASQAKLRNLRLNANKASVLIYDTNELEEDAPGFATYVKRVAPDELAFLVDAGIYAGPGAGQPLGMINAPAYIQVPKDNGQASGSITTQNVLNMRGRMPASSRKTAIWVCNQDLESQLLNLTRGSGTAVEFIYKLPGERGNTSEMPMLLGSPVVIIEQASANGVVGDISYVDPNMYYLGRRGGLRTDTSIHVAFVTDQNAYRFILRVDGQPVWQQPRAQYNGGLVLSPYVGLAARP